MRKIVICAILIIVSLCCSAQTKVAVYVTSSDDTEKGILKIIGSELTSAIVATKEYSAVERTSDFLSKIAEEQAFQRTGAVDDAQISALGKQFGVDMVCVVDVIKFKDIYYINARLIDVEKATVFATSRESSSLADMNSIISMSENLANSLFSKKETTKNEIIYSKEVSTCLYQPERCQIRSIENNTDYTIVHFVFDFQNSPWIQINEGTYIVDKERGTRYGLVKAENIDVSPKRTMRKQNEIQHNFTLYFEPIPDSVRKIDIIETTTEGTETSWVWKTIRLMPYGKSGLYIFDVEPVKKITKEEPFKPTLKMSTCLSCPSYLKIKKIIATSESTTVYCTFKNHNDADYISVSKKMYLLDETTKKKYMLRNTKDITVYPKVKSVNLYGNYEFELQFDPIPLSSKVISIVHPDERNALQKIADAGRTVFFNCYSITLYPYSKPGEYILNFF
ncbi:MAG: hypothetical protein IJK84_00100 [Bacteroidales bacterium]|nr:hypothetical protein [Bacteroidales bacterium]